MKTPISLERCLSFINCQMQPSGQSLSAMQNGALRRAITISRQAGSGAHTIASSLATLLAQRSIQGSCPWTVFDRNLVEKVLEDHHLPSHLAEFMPEDRISALADIMDELFGLHPPSDTLVNKIAQTILHLVELGNVIIIGRAAHVITAKLDYVFRVRLVSSLPNRIRHVMALNRCTEKQAHEWIEREDAGRRRYLKTYFNTAIDDPLLYHLVINTDLVKHDEAAHMIADQIYPVKPALKEEPKPAWV